MSPLVLGPSSAGIVTARLVAGRSGLREYRSRLVRWRVGARWDVIALLAASRLLLQPLVIGRSLLVAGIISRSCHG